MKPETRAFIGVGLAALLGAAALHGFYLLDVNGAWGAHVHLTIFGWISAMIIAVNYHTMPVFAARDFPSQALIRAHMGIFAPGAPLVAAGLLLDWQPGIIFGLLLQIIAAFLFCANVVLLLTRGARRPMRAPPPPIPGQKAVDRIATRATAGAGLSLPIALILMLLGRLGWLGGGWWLAGEHLATLGWIMLMIVGVAYHVLPRFSGLATRGERWAGAQLGCHLVALVIMVPALGFGWTLPFALGGVLMAIAAALFALTIWPTLRVISARPAAIREVMVRGGRS